jgi:hypothetical protein
MWRVQRPPKDGEKRAPFADYWCSSEAACERRIEEEIESENHQYQMQREEQARSIERQKKMREQVQVGTIVCRTWGYDQTNVNFWQVIDRKKGSAVIRPIGAETNPRYGGGSMTDEVRPRVGDFTGPERTARISQWGVTVKRGEYATPTDPETWHYRSTYA